MASGQWSYFNGSKETHHNFSAKLWTESYLALNTSNKALINFESKPSKRQRKSKRKYDTRWAELPDLLLEQIFTYLTIREKYYASLVCQNWHRAFYLPDVWSQFVLGDNTLTRARFNYYEGWQYVLDHVRTQSCLTQVGVNFRKLTFEPMLNFFNLYEFMNMVSWYCEQSDNKLIQVKGIGRKIKTLKFTFPCNMDARDDDERATLFGTGGRLLGALKRLMYNLKSLKHLELIDLMLEFKEAQHLLDDVCDICCLTLKRLVLINTTKIQYQLLHVGVFLNLHVLQISPQNLGDDVVELIGNTKLRHLHIYQNRYTPDFIVNKVSKAAWKNCTKNNPNLMVHLELECLKDKAMIYPDGAPVKSVIYNSSQLGVKLHEVIKLIEMYKTTLKTYGHRCIPRGYRPRKFHERIDESLMYLCRQCQHLQTLVVTERISTCTVLLIATTCRNLTNLYVRRNAVVKKFDWEHNPDWSDEFHHWLKSSSGSYDSVEREVSQLLGRRWAMLSDVNFKKLVVDFYEE